PEAEALYRESLEMRRKILEPQHPDMAAALYAVGLVLHMQRQFAQAEPLLREALAINTKRRSAGDWQTQTTASLLGAVLSEQKKFDEAEPLLLEACRVLSTHSLPPISQRYREAVSRTIALYDAWGKPQQPHRSIREMPVQNCGLRGIGPAREKNPGFVEVGGIVHPLERHWMPRAVMEQHQVLAGFGLELADECDTIFAQS